MRWSAIAFSCCAIPSVVEGFHRDARPKVVLAGMETHVCVQQTVLDLLADGFRVYLAVDAINARHEIDYVTALLTGLLAAPAGQSPGG